MWHGYEKNVQASNIKRILISWEFPGAMKHWILLAYSVFSWQLFGCHSNSLPMVLLSMTVTANLWFGGVDCMPIGRLKPAMGNQRKDFVLNTKSSFQSKSLYMLWFWRNSKMKKRIQARTAMSPMGSYLQISWIILAWTISFFETIQDVSINKVRRKLHLTHVL